VWKCKLTHSERRAHRPGARIRFDRTCSNQLGDQPYCLGCHQMVVKNFGSNRCYSCYALTHETCGSSCQNCGDRFCHSGCYWTHEPCRGREKRECVTRGSAGRWNISRQGTRDVASSATSRVPASSGR
jgi:hypothetical protein